ncbi:MAG: GDP-mannose 4,6-dehydratase [Candidatus Omnitrophica bacterium]|nr:GDP-mannose 4,6-dehydratase [Candidatus Omnitrophota bacterium]
MKKALITGVTGQDGSYLAEFLLSKGYTVHGIIRRSSTFNRVRVSHLFREPHEKGVRFFLHYGDISNSEPLSNLIYNIRPDEIYHLAAQSHVRVSFDTPEFTGDVTGLGMTRLLDAVRHSKIKTKIYQASSSEIFGNAPAPQNEETSFEARSPYAAAKIYAHHMANLYREGYGLHICCGILFNHESPRRGEAFVSRKITRSVALIKKKEQKKLYLGNLDAKRDWGYAPEYVEAMWMILQQPVPDDYVVGTGETHSVKEFVNLAFSYVGLNWKRYVEIDPRYLRPNEVDCLQADSSKARRRLGWAPRVSFEELVHIMVDADMERVGLKPVGKGKSTVARHFKKSWHKWMQGQ